jgi:hypothetical protein
MGRYLAGEGCRLYKLLSRYSPGGIEENHETPSLDSGYLGQMMMLITVLVGLIDIYSKEISMPYTESLFKFLANGSAVPSHDLCCSFPTYIKNTV